MATKNDNRTNNDPQNFAHKTKDRVTRTPQNERNLTYYIVDIDSKWKNFTGKQFTFGFIFFKKREQHNLLPKNCVKSIFREP
jgi:hypothetical protein